VNKWEEENEMRKKEGMVFLAIRQFDEINMVLTSG
jgi:hypothetical protein